MMIFRNKAQRITLLFEDMERQPHPWSAWVHPVNNSIHEFSHEERHIQHLPIHYDVRPMTSDDVIRQGWARVGFNGNSIHIDTYGHTPEMLEYLRQYFLRRGVSRLTTVYWEDIRTGQYYHYVLADMGLGPSLTRRFR